MATIADLIHDHQNARRHSPRNISMIQESLRRFGANRGIVAARQDDGTYRVYAGNGVLEAANAEGLDKVKLIEVSGDEIPVMVVDHLTPEQLEAYALADNRTSETSEWDLEAIQEAIDRGVELDWMWNPEEFDGLMADLAVLDEDIGGLTDPDEIPETPEQPITLHGDIWQLGRHRVMCGDSTVVTDVDRLMDGHRADLLFTDPPYGVDYVGKTRRALTIENDNLGDEGTRQLVADALTIAPLKPGGVFYVCSPAGLTETAFRLAIADAGLQLRQCLVWAKQQFVMGRQDYHWRHESILYGWADGAAHYFVDDRTQDTVWEIDRPHRNAEHPTMKPVELIEKAIRNSSQPRDRVVDLFGGSGTTLIGCEQANRTAHVMELDPKYVDVICRRYFEFTGVAPVRESDGYTWEGL